MRYARHFFVTFLIFVAILLVGLFISNQPFGAYSASTPDYLRPVTVDVCNQNISRSWTGAYESQGCSTAINHNWNYFYQSTVTNGSASYVPYMN
jgi:hypothetical protein